MTKALLIPEEFSLMQAKFLASVFQSDGNTTFEEREIHMDHEFYGDATARKEYELVLARCCKVDEDGSLRIKESFIKEV